MTCIVIIEALLNLVTSGGGFALLAPLLLALLKIQKCFVAIAIGILNMLELWVLDMIHTMLEKE
jgi:hypothetical protein